MGWYLVLVMSMFGETMTTTFTSFNNEEACNKAKVQIVQLIDKAPGASPSVKVATCVKNF